MHANVRRGTSPLGLTLTKTPSFVELIETTLSKHSEQKTRKHKPQFPDEKMKPSNIPVISLQIGSWKVSLVPPPRTSLGISELLNLTNRLKHISYC